MNYKGYIISPDKDIRFFVISPEKGKLPDVMKGVFTSVDKAKVTIDAYLMENVYAKAIAKS